MCICMIKGLCTIWLVWYVHNTNIFYNEIEWKNTDTYISNKYSWFKFYKTNKKGTCEYRKFF